MKIASLTALLFVAACSSGPEVRAVSDQGANFSQYRSFGFASPLGTDQGGYQTVVSQTLKASTRREMEARGLSYDATNPQLIVNFGASLADRLKTTTTPAPAMGMGVGYGRGYYGYRGGMYSTWPQYQDQTTVTQYKQGTLNIDVADVARRQLVWEGTVIGSVTQKSYDNVPATLDRAVVAAFQKFPIPAPK